MIFKILPLIMLLGVGVRFLAKFLELNANRKKLKAQQEGRLEQYYADKEAFWRNVDRLSLVVIGVAVVWYAVGVVLWLLGD